ncbi:MAG: T9SS type A sorting domain-containing protein [Bacteroidetes bacterium]|nr:T9SS type A sorting domain-containing protein [Bacteroidota bacterium]
MLGDGASSPYTQCRLVSTLGQTVYSQSIGTGTRQLELSGLPAGLYTLILDGGTEPVAQKVVVQP